MATTAPPQIRVGDQMKSARDLCVVTGIENRRTIVTYRVLDDWGYEGREQVVSAERFFEIWSFAGR